MDGVNIDAGRHVLLLWGGGSPPDNLESTVQKLQERVQNTGRVQLEHIERLQLSGHNAATFDVVISGYLGEVDVQHTDDLLAEIARLLKPSGKLYLCDEKSKSEKLIPMLKLSGYVSISEPSESENKIQLAACKPAYDVGSSSQLKLSFAKKVQPKVDSDVAKVWTLSVNDMLDDDVDIMDSDELLDEEDLMKPNPEALRADCGTGPGKKKACKNCTCGLAEELDSEVKSTKTVSSACGSCYLGDAFRCASCPYLGMPAFKPGEKISLSDRQLKADK